MKLEWSREKKNMIECIRCVIYFTTGHSCRPTGPCLIQRTHCWKISWLKGQTGVWGRKMETSRNTYDPWKRPTTDSTWCKSQIPLDKETFVAPFSTVRFWFCCYFEEEGKTRREYEEKLRKSNQTIYAWHIWQTVHQVNSFTELSFVYPSNNCLKSSSNHRVARLIICIFKCVRSDLAG